MLRYLLILLILTNVCHAQTLSCDGNLGENIFPEGDFGSGAANIPFIDPGIAPGYTYINSNPPPIDGSYCLTNNIAVWNNGWGWSEIGDNSGDPQGYMMVVNASYDAGLFYEETVTDLCENTIYNFSVDVINLHVNNNLILPNLTFLIDDFAVYETGNVDDNGAWQTYSFTFKTDPGQTTVKLALRNNAPGGNGNDLALDNIAFQACGPEAFILPTTIANICEDGDPIELEATIQGDQFNTPQVQWQQSFDEGETWVDIAGANDLSYFFDNLGSGTYYFRYLLANQIQNLTNPKCHIISNIKLVQVLPKFTDYTDSICDGLESMLGDQSYNETGVFVDTFTNFLGCDSIVELNLNVIFDPGIEADFIISDPSCDYTEDGTIDLEEIRKGVGPYSLFIEGVGAPNENTNFTFGVGTYNYIITDRYGCSSEFELELNEGESMQADLGEDLLVSLGDFVEIVALTNIPASAYEWFPVSLLNCVNCDRQNFQPTEDMSVIVTATSELGCSDSDTLLISVRVNRDIFLPNIFTPNGDNINDRYSIFPYAASIESVRGFQIYDRWGNKVFDANNFSPLDESIFWDGTFNGRPVQSGIYSYMVDILYIDGEEVISSGTITLIR